MTGTGIAGVALALACATSMAQEPFPAAQIKLGAGIFAQNCSACHGARMLDPQAAFDLRSFPQSEKSRFVLSVVKGKNQMPPWGDLFKPEEIEALWAYVIAGER